MPTDAPNFTARDKGRARAAAFLASLRDAPAPGDGAERAAPVPTDQANLSAERRERATEIRQIRRMVRPDPKPATAATKPAPAPRLPEAEIAREHAKGASIAALARRYGAGRMTIIAVIDRNGRKRGSRCGVDAAEAVAFWRTGRSVTEVAEHFCIGESTAYHLIAVHATAAERHDRKRTRTRAA